MPLIENLVAKPTKIYDWYLGGTSTAEGLFYPYNELIRFLTGKIFFIIYKHFHLLTFWWTEFGGLAGGGEIFMEVTWENARSHFYPCLQIC